MKLKGLGIILVSLLIFQVFLIGSSKNSSVAAQNSNSTPDVFVGVDVAYDNITATKILADAIRPYANLIIIGCTYGIDSRNTTRLNELFDLCKYLYDKGFYFMIYDDLRPSAAIVQEVRKYGDHFLGFYAYDELGGRQLDQADGFISVPKADNYSDASNKFVGSISGWLGNSTYGFSRNFAYQDEFSLFTTDYALYWYDYEAGYDTVFAELGWNYSRQLNVALCRGAATVQNKDWGAMILWKYTNPPYLESSSEMYDDMVLAYNNGAKYIAVFDTSKDYTQETLTMEHLDAMKQFWQYTKTNPRSSFPSNYRVAYLLPQDYAYGFRGPNDKIWGLWEAANDSIALDLSISVNIMLNTYGTMLDIVYEDAFQQGNAHGYYNLIYWNDPTPVQDSWPKLPTMPTQTPNQTPNPTPIPTPTPTPTPTPDVSSLPSPTPTMPSTFAPTSDPPKNVNSPLNALYFATIVVAIAGGALGSTFALRRRKK